MSISSLLYEVVLSDLEDSVCVICIEEFENHTMAAKLSCGHVFHEMCIAKWLIKNRKCPICYQDFKYGIDLKTDYQYKKNETRVDDYETKSNCSEDTFEVKKKWGRRSKRYCEMMQRTRRLFKGRFYTIGEGGESSFIVDRDENDKGYLSV